MASDTNNIGLYIAVAGSGQSTREVMSGIGTPVMPDGSVKSQVGHSEWYWDVNSVQTDQYEVGAASSNLYDLDNTDYEKFNQFPGGVGLAGQSHFGEAIGFSTAVDGDHMVIGAPFGWSDVHDGGGISDTKSVDYVATQTYMEGVPGHTPDCFGVITVTVTGDLAALWKDRKFGKFCFLGHAWSYAGTLAEGASPPTSWGALTWYDTSYDSGEEGIEGSATLKLYPCDSSKDCWIGFGTCGGPSIGFTEDEAGTRVLYKEGTITNTNTTGKVVVQGGLVYTFKKPRGKITNATNATPIVITVDDWDVLSSEDRAPGVGESDEANWSGAKNKIQDVTGNRAANGEYYLRKLSVLGGGSAYTAELYNDPQWKSPVAGNGDFKAGGSWKGVGPDSWIKTGTITPPFPGGFTSWSVMHLAPDLEDAVNPCVGGGADDDRTNVLQTEYCFGWDVDLKDGWILVGEPRGKQWWHWGGRGYGPMLRSRIDGIRYKHSWREGSFASSETPSPNSSSATWYRSYHGGDRSPAGRVYIYHADNIANPVDHPNPHLRHSPYGGANYRGYIGSVPNARIAPEYLYSRDNEQVQFDMGTVTDYSGLGPMITPFSLENVNSRFGHSVAFSPKNINAPIGPDNPVTILVGAPYSRIDKDEIGLLGEEDDVEDDSGPGDFVPDPSGDDFGGEDPFNGEGSSGGDTPGEGGVPGQPPEEPDASKEREKLEKVGHAYAFIDAYPDSGGWGFPTCLWEMSI